ncbi:type II secretion system F family protein [Aquibaculum sediminis]|uniref:type II secretion system F family protein n=1 Tax=Aquibaculum sediminis TaxID=3231907 RepID=UPI0034541C10
MSDWLTPVHLLLFLGLLACFLPLFIVLGRAISGDERRMHRRMLMAAKGGALRQAPRRVDSVRREEGARSLRSLDRLLSRGLPRHSGLAQRLQRSGSGLTLAGYALCCVVAGFVVLLLLMVLAGMSLPLALFGGIALGLLLPHIVIGVMIGRRQAKFLSALPEALDVIVRGLRSGLPIIDSIGVVAREFEDPIAGEFLAISDGVRLGRPLEQAVADAANRIDLPDFRFFAVAVAIQRETGGNLGETLQSLSSVLRGRQQLKLKVKALSAEARSGAMIVGSLPPAMLFLLNLLNPDYVGVLFNDPRGQIMLGVAALLIVAGAGTMMKMGKIKA